jgi:hypothetical protein
LSKYYKSIFVGNKATQASAHKFKQSDLRTAEKIAELEFEYPYTIKLLREIIPDEHPETWYHQLFLEVCTQKELREKGAGGVHGK